MSFASSGFFIFFACLMLVYFCMPKRFRWISLLAGSYVYILLSSRYTASFLLVASLTAFGAARWIERQQQTYAQRLAQSAWSAQEKKVQKKHTQKKKRSILSAALIVLFGMLAVLKYANFGLDNLSALLGCFGVQPLGRVNWLLPLGISFYTLQISGYIIDVYRGKYAADKNFFKFLLFTSWFPQLVQGPISRHDDLAAQLIQGHDFDWQRAKSGVLRMLWGYFKKLVIADRLALVVVPLFGDFAAVGYYGAYIWLGVLLYTFQIYADFSGGMDIVLGLSEVFGIRMTENFRRPMLAGSVAEFWQRWHITLGSWMRDYLFYPLALSGCFNKLGKKLRKRFGPYVAKVAPAVLASFIVFTMVGVWHGAEWKFFVYGCYQAIFVSTATLLEPLYARMRDRLHVRAQSVGFQVFRVLRTFVIITIGRMFSRAATLADALRLFEGSVQTWNPQVLWDGSMLTAFPLNGWEWLVLAIAIALWMAVDMLNERGIVVRERLEARALPLRWAMYILATMAVLVFGVYGPGFDAAGFIYGAF